MHRPTSEMRNGPVSKRVQELKQRSLGIQISDAYEDLKLYRMGNYPVIRGTALPLGDRSAYLWTSGFVPRLDTYMGPETPNPIMVRVQRGECDLRGVLSDVYGPDED